MNEYKSVRENIWNGIYCGVHFLDYDRRDVSCVLSLYCWLKIALILLIYAIGAINLIEVVESKDKLYNPTSKADFIAVSSIKISLAYT